MLFDTYHRQIKNSFSISKNVPLYKKRPFVLCLHHLQFMKTRSSSSQPELTSAEVFFQFMKTRCRYCLQNQWALAVFCLTQVSPSSPKNWFNIKFLLLEHSLYLCAFRFQTNEMLKNMMKVDELFFIKATWRLFRYEVNARLLKVFATFSARHCFILAGKHVSVNKSTAFCFNSRHFKTGDFTERYDEERG